MNKISEKIIMSKKNAVSANSHMVAKENMINLWNVPCTNFKKKPYKADSNNY